jgi:hypothetical protein
MELGPAPTAGKMQSTSIPYAANSLAIAVLLDMREKNGGETGYARRSTSGTVKFLLYFSTARTILHSG